MRVLTKNCLETGFEFFPAEPDAIIGQAGGLLSISSALLESLAVHAFTRAAFFFTRRHLERLIALAHSPAASANDRFVLSWLLQNAAVSSRRQLPLCQDTGIAAVFGFKTGAVLIHGAKSEPRAFTDAVRHVYAAHPLRFSTTRPRDFFDEYDPRDNLPAQIFIFSSDPFFDEGRGGAPPLVAGEERPLHTPPSGGDEQRGTPIAFQDAVSAPPQRPGFFCQEPSYRLLFSAKGGGSSNKTKLIQGTKAHLDKDTFRALLREEIAAIGASACPPYTIAVAAGGLSPEQNLLALKLATSGWFDTSPLRDHELEAFVLETAQKTGIGCGAGGAAFALDAVVLRLPRHGASCPISIGVSCSAHRCLNAVITKDGCFIEKTVQKPQELPGFEEAVSLARGAPDSGVCLDTTRGIAACLDALKDAAPGSRVSVSGPLLVARDAAHARWKALLQSGRPLPEYAARYPIFYAGPAQTPPGCACGSIGPTTAGRMDDYCELLMPRGASLVTLAKGTRSPAWKNAAKKYGAVYLGIPGGCAALITSEFVQSVSVIDYEELGMEAVRLLDVKNLPAFVLIDGKGNDFYAAD